MKLWKINFSYVGNIILDMPYKVIIDLFPNGAPQLQQFYRFQYVVQFILVQGNERTR